MLKKRIELHREVWEGDRPWKCDATAEGKKHISA